MGQRQLSETMPLDISRRGTPIFCTFSVAFTHSCVVLIHNQRMHTLAGPGRGRTFATLNRTEHLTPEKRIFQRRFFLSFLLFLGLLLVLIPFLPFSVGAAKIKSIKNAQRGEFGTYRLDELGWAVARSSRRKEGEGGWEWDVPCRRLRCCACNNLARKKAARRRWHKLKTTKNTSMWKEVEQGTRNSGTPGESGCGSLLMLN